jgi:chaperone LolA
MNVFYCRWAGAIAFVLLASATNGSETSALNQLVDRLNQFDQLHLRYEQVTLGDLSDPTSGEFLLKRPAQFKLLPDDDGAVVLSDGKTLWTQDDLLAQVTAQPLDSLSTFSPARLMLMSLPEIDAAFDVQFASSDRLSFTLTPKDERELVRSVGIVFDAQVPVQITLVSRANQRVSVGLTAISVNQAISNDAFTVEIGDDVDFVDYR